MTIATVSSLGSVLGNMERSARCEHKNNDRDYRTSEFTLLRFIFLVVRVPVVICHEAIMSQNAVCV
jgi:hypothetical protein